MTAAGAAQRRSPRLPRGSAVSEPAGLILELRCCWCSCVGAFLGARTSAHPCTSRARFTLSSALLPLSNPRPAGFYGACVGRRRGRAPPRTTWMEGAQRNGNGNGAEQKQRRRPRMGTRKPNHNPPPTRAPAANSSGATTQQPEPGLRERASTPLPPPLHSALGPRLL